MMLRTLVVILMLANVVFYAWSQGYIDIAKQFTPSFQRETYRLAEQIEPERIVIENAKKDVITTPSVLPVTNAVKTDDAKPKICLNSSILNDRQRQEIQQVLEAKLSSLRWHFEPTAIPARWIIYMGKYANDEQRNLKKIQLERIRVRYESLSEKNLEPGLSLGSYDSQTAAEQAMQQLVKQGVRTARVLQETPEQKGHTLVFPALDDTNRDKLNAAYATLTTQPGIKPLQTCKI